MNASNSVIPEAPLEQLPALDPLLRLARVRALVGGVSASTIWRWVQAGNFPAPVRLGDNVVAWRASEIGRGSKRDDPRRRSRRSDWAGGKPKQTLWKQAPRARVEERVSALEATDDGAS